MADDKYLGKYRIPSARFKGWDYRSSAHYFITICTANRMHYFGEIKDDKMVGSNMGIVAHILWHEMIHHYPQGLIELREFVVMPNHIHGIITLNNNVETQHAASDFTDDESNDSSINESNDSLMETQHAASLQERERGSLPIPNLNPNSISSIVRNYKSAVTKYARRLVSSEFAWQTRFYDHIIRNEESYGIIANYIRTNPENWNKDKFFT